MATQISGEVFQDSLRALTDGNTPPFPMLRMGVPVGASKWDLFALQGKMFTAHQATIGTAIAGSAADAGGIVLTAPSFRFSVPTGTTVFVRHLNIALATAAGTVNEVALAYTNSNSYTSGGTAVVPLNWRTDNPLATVVTSCYVAAGSAIVENTLSSPRILYQDLHPLAFAAGESHYRIDKWFDDLIPVVGPASVLFWLSAATTSASMLFSIDWAEIATSSAITAV